MTKRRFFVPALALTIAGAVVFPFASCSSQGAIAIPGEGAVVQKNINNEYFSIAAAYENVGNYDKAIEYYTKAMRDDSLRDSCYYKIGRCHALKKNWLEALEIYKNLLEKDPGNNSLKTSVAYITAMSGDFDGALGIYAELREANPEDEKLLVNYIAVLLAAGRYELAEEQYYVLKETFPDSESLSTIKTKIADGLDNMEEEKASSTPSS